MIKERLSSCIKLTFSLSIFMLIFFPKILLPIRLVFLLTTVLLSLLYLRTWRIPKQYFILFLVNYSVCVLGFVKGLLNSNVALDAMWHYYLIFPLIFLYASGFVNQSNIGYFIKKVFEPIAFYFLIFIFLIQSIYLIDITAIPKIFYEFNSISIGSLENKFGFSHPSSIYILLSFSYFLFKILFMSLGNSKDGFKVTLFCVIISFLLICMSGRKTFLLIVVLFSFLAVIIWSYNIPKFGSVIVSMQILLLIPLSFFLLSFVFNALSDLDVLVRGEQFYALLNYISLAPFFGHGIGVYVPLSYRSSVNYEWWVLYQMVEFGLIGFSTIFFSLIFITISLGKAYRLNMPNISLYYLPMLYGIISIFISSMTNPYLGKFDASWMLFFPFLMLISLRRA